MKIYRQIFLASLSFFMLGLSSCYMSQYSSAGEIDISGSDYQELRVFTSGFNKALYKAEMKVHGHEFAGLMMIKEYDHENYKVAFFSELGLSFFDFELRRSNARNKFDLIVNSIYAPLDRNILLNNIEKYFSMLLSPGLDQGSCKSYLKKDGSRVMIRVNSYKGKDAYLSRNLIDPYTDIVNTGKLLGRERITIEIAKTANGRVPASISIKQAGLDMQFLLELITE